MSNFITEKTAYAIYKLLDVKRVGAVSANKILDALNENNIEPHCLREGCDNVDDERTLSTILKADQLEQLRTEDSHLRNVIDQLVEQQCGFLIVNHPDYPQQMKDALGRSTPPILSYYGNLALLSTMSVGFCGSRKASEQGLNVADDCATQLAASDVAITSGYAAGVDRRAHFSALSAGGNTIIVLPEGLTRFSIHRELASVWDWDQVLVISEFLPHAKWSVSRAMQRNRTIIGISCAMILIEAGEKGGSMDAGQKTLAMNRRLFAPVYEGMPEFARGNQILIEKGATPLRKNKTTQRANLRQVVEALDCSPVHGSEQLSLIS